MHNFFVFFKTEVKKNVYSATFNQYSIKTDLTQIQD